MQSILLLIVIFSCYVDPHTRHDHIELQTEQWHNQIDRLVDSYLDYRLRDRGDGMPSIADAAPAVEGSDCPSLTGIDLVDLFGMYFFILVCLPDLLQVVNGCHWNLNHAIAIPTRRSSTMVTWGAPLYIRRLQFRFIPS